MATEIFTLVPYVCGEVKLKVGMPVVELAAAAWEN